MRTIAGIQVDYKCYDHRKDTNDDWNAWSQLSGEDITLDDVGIALPTLALSSPFGRLGL